MIGDKPKHVYCKTHGETIYLPRGRCFNKNCKQDCPNRQEIPVKEKTNVSGR